MAAAPERAGSQHSPIFGVTIPDGYRQWELIAPSAYREGTLPFPDGAMLAKMVEDAKKYASTGGWGFGRFLDGTPADEPQPAAWTVSVVVLVQCGCCGF